MKKNYDITMKISPNMPVWKNYPHKKPVIELVTSQKEGASVNETSLKINIHTGTHMDFPFHVDSNGLTSSSLELSRLIRVAKVFDLTHVKEVITLEDLKKLDINEDDSVLFKTTNSFDLEFNKHFVYLSGEGASYLASLKVNLVGIDALGIERDNKDYPAHHHLMDNGIYIIEGVALKDVKEGTYMLYALPIKIDNADGLLLSAVLSEL